MQSDKTFHHLSTILLACLLLAGCDHTSRSSQIDTSLPQSAEPDTLTSTEYEKLFHNWIADTSRNLKNEVLHLNPQVGIRTREVFVRDDSSEVIVTDRYQFHYIPQDTFHQDTRDALVLKLLSEYKESPSKESDIQFIDEARYSRSYVPQNRYEYIHELDSIFIIDHLKRTKTEYSYIRGRYSDKTVTYLNAKPPRTEYYEFLWPGDSLVKKLIRTNSNK